MASHPKSSLLDLYTLGCALLQFHHSCTAPCLSCYCLSQLCCILIPHSVRLGCLLGLESSSLSSSNLLVKSTLRCSGCRSGVVLARGLEVNFGGVFGGRSRSVTMASLPGLFPQPDSVLFAVEFFIVAGGTLQVYIRGCHGVSRGCDLACEVAHGLFWFGVARCGRWEYSLCAKASQCPIFCSGGEE